MWLLDANLPVQLVQLLNELGIAAETSAARGWNTLSNGALVRAATAAGFSALLTRDRLFAQAAASELRSHPDFAIVQIRLPQLRATPFLSAFRTAWLAREIAPTPGQVVIWPVP
jgi:Domain of unknown function (DUF5615)